MSQPRCEIFFSSILNFSIMLRSVKYLKVKIPVNSVRQLHSTNVFRNTQSQDFINTIIKPYTATTYARPDIVFTHGKGSHLYDLENKEYIDFIAGIAVTALGHSNPDVTNLVQSQVDTLIHCSNLFYNLHAGELCNKLVTKTKSSGGMHDASRVFLCNSGTEANEAALKFARKYGKTYGPEKYEIITFENAFHGRSMGALSVTPNPKYQEAFAPLIPGVKVAQTNIESVKSLIDKEKTCGVIIEPIQGEGGVTEIDPEFLIQLRQLCTENNVVLIYDEIQCGLGRSGKLWAHSSLPEEGHPDIVTMAKALGNGFPIGATMINDKIENVLKVGDHGTTYGGNPLGAKIGTYVVEKVSDQDFLKAVELKSAKFTENFQKIIDRYPDLIKLKGKGLLLGLQFDSSVDTGKIIEECRDNGLLILSAGMNVIRFVPALNVPDETIAAGLEIFTKAIDKQLKK